MKTEYNLTPGEARCLGFQFPDKIRVCDTLTTWWPDGDNSKYAVEYRLPGDSVSNGRPAGNWEDAQPHAVRIFA